MSLASTKERVRKVENHLLPQAGLVSEIELFHRLAGREVSRTDACFAALCLPGKNLLFQKCGEEVLVAPALVARPFSNPRHGLRDARRFHLVDKVGQVVHATSSSSIRAS